ncbi:hypothetical protein [Achromobacter deleyi]|uniref:hypothetical protein n=1 Tax=Achromobacter deleyi TaxID=1353891 RepID=UPI0014694047|nr:hypothetical protein [Achromobacter deleyi]CAB3821532.1 hypothetical protein LMG3412_00282 [Achromobacter deleyi]
MRIKLFPACAALALSVLGSNAYALEETQVPPPKPSSLTRADIAADQDAWRKSGLAELWRQEQTPDIHSSEYRQRYAMYLSLIGHSPERRAANNAAAN